MRNRSRAAVLIVAAILLSIFLYISPSGSGTVSVLQGAPSHTVVGDADHVQGSLVSFTVYTGENPTAVNSILSSYEESLGLALHSFGILDVLTVPSSHYDQATMFLSTLSKQVGVRYFHDNDSIGFVPMETFQPVSLSLQNSSIYYPQNIYQAYNYTSANRDNTDGNGTTVVIVDAYGDPYLGYDVAAFDNLTGLPPINLVITYTNNTPLQYNEKWAIETALDVEWVHASAPGARIDLVLAQNANASLEQALSFAIYYRLGSVISLSWGEPEFDYMVSNQVGALSTLNDLFRQAAQDGITVLAASGDYGAYAQTSHLTVDFPASDPYVTGVGGTDLTELNGNYSETGWGGTINGTTFGSGGGFSSVFGSQWWESAPSFNSTRRGLPDVSADADLSTGVLIVENGTTFEAGGTSLATPIWAGIVARTDQYLGRSVGFLNPVLYQISRSPLYEKALNQVTRGTNGFYNATAGWNPVTGLGTPNVDGLLQTIRKILEPAGFVITGNASHNFTGVSADLSVQGNGSLYFNGTDFYYLSLYHNGTGYLKFGYAVNQSGSYLLTCGLYSNYSFMYSHYLGGSYSFSLPVNMEIRWQGLNYTFIFGNYSRSQQIFFPCAGSSYPSLGAQSISSDSNLSNFYSSNFSHLALICGSLSSNMTDMYEEHFSAVSVNYSSISGQEENGTVHVYESQREINGRLPGYNNSTADILFTMDYQYPLMVVLSSTVNSSSSTWSVNNATLSGPYFFVGNAGIYNIKEVTPHVTLYRSVYIAPLQETYLNITNVYQMCSPMAHIVINHVYSLCIKMGHYDNITIPVMGYNDSISVDASGYHPICNCSPMHRGFISTLIPLDTHVTILPLPASAEVSLNNTTGNSVVGGHEFTLSPGRYNFSVEQAHYSTYNGSVSVRPGENLTVTVPLKPLSGLVRLSGRVYDQRFGYNLTGVLVYVNSSLFTFSNESGCFTLFLEAGTYALNFSLDHYSNTTMSLNVTNTTFVNVSMEGSDLNLLPFFSLFVNSAFPFMFFLLYLSWSTKYSVTKFAVYYSLSPDFVNATPHYVPSTQTTMLLTLAPLSIYYIEIFGYAPGGQIISSHEVVVYSGSPIYIGISILIYVGIILYTIVAVRYIRKVFTPPRRF